jgi:folate-dependent phosphoribosylglycinamide formyltransferase PurN
MTVFEVEKISELVKPDDFRRSYLDDAFEWGEMSVPGKNDIRYKSEDGLKVLFIGSCTPGLLVLDSIKRLEIKLEGAINLIAVVTDAPVDDRARISTEKRIWRFFSREERQHLYDGIKEEALSFGAPCYSGAVKNDAFRKLLKVWKPELIVMCCYGQMVDAQIFSFPAYGMYNLHPSDLASSIGIGTKPVEHTVSLGHKTSRTTFHRVNEIMDGGAIIGKSPEISIVHPDGCYPENTLALYNKVCSVCGWMAIDLIMAVLERKSKGEQGGLESLDFEESMPENVKSMLMEPVPYNLQGAYKLPLHTSLCGESALKR